MAKVIQRGVYPCRFGPEVALAAIAKAKGEEFNEPIQDSTRQKGVKRMQKIIIINQDEAEVVTKVTQALDEAGVNIKSLNTEKILRTEHHQPHHRQH